MRRDGQVYSIAFENGEKVEDLHVTGTCGKRNTGTSVHFWPDESFFDSPRFSVSRLTHLLKAKAVLCPGVEIVFRDQVNNSEQSWCYADGLNDYLSEAVNGAAAAGKTIRRRLLRRDGGGGLGCCGCRKAANC